MDDESMRRTQAQMGRAVQEATDAAADMGVALERAAEDADLRTLCRWLVQLDAFHKEMKSATTQLFQCKDLLDKFKIPARMEADGVERVSYPELEATFYPVTRVSAALVPDETGSKAAAMQWLRANDMESLITETVNANTLAAAVRDMMETEGAEPPADIVKITTYTTTGRRKYVPKTQGE